MHRGVRNQRELGPPLTQQCNWASGLAELELEMPFEFETELEEAPLGRHELKAASSALLQRAQGSKPPLPSKSEVSSASAPFLIPTATDPTGLRGSDLRSQCRTVVTQLVGGGSTAKSLGGAKSQNALRPHGATLGSMPAMS